MRTRSLKILALGLLAFMYIAPVAKAQEKKEKNKGIEFFDGTWQEAMDLSKKTNKPIFVDAYTTWCGPCKWMAANAFPNEDVGKFFNKHFINFKMDMQRGEGPEFGRIYRVAGYPTLLFLNGDGGVIHRTMGMHSASQLLQLGQMIPEMTKKDKKSDKKESTVQSE